MSIYKITKEYLSKTCDPHETGTPPTNEQMLELHQKLLAIDPEYRMDTGKKEEVRRAFTNFYVDSAKVALFFKGSEQIIVKLIPYVHGPDESVYIKKISDYLLSTKHKFGEADRKKNILMIPHKHVEGMNRLLQEFPGNIDTRKILRKAINDVFKLEKHDSVFFMNGKVVVRFFKQTETERRFEGLPAEEIKKIADGIYSGEGESDMAGDLDMVISTLSDTTLNFAEIDNLFFNTRHVKIIQEGLVRFYQTKITQDETVIKAVANYIFRESFYYIHELLAEKLLELIERKDKNAEAFLRYYNGSTFIENGEKLIAPEIVDEGGQKWNIAAIVNFISQFSKNRTLISKKESSIRAFKGEEKEIATQIAAASPLVAALVPDKPVPPELQEKIVLQLEANRHILDKSRTGNQGLSVNDLSPGEIHEEFQKSLRDLHKRIDFLHMRIESDQKSIEEIQSKFADQQKQYDMLIIAISEVLMDRKTPAAIKDNDE